MSDLEAKLEFRVGTDFLRDFVAGHNAVDVLRELVQNEYDAGGSRLVAAFGRSEVRISGDGSVIDRAGWRRLSVMLSTGNVAGGTFDLQIKPKVNGIGSKNLGLRTLFLVGDRIEVRSGGRMTLLDLNLGTLPEPVDDPSSAVRGGIDIRVPYRLVDSGTLQAFTVEREAEALERFTASISHVLSKLAMPNSGKSLTHVKVTSERLDRSLGWSQDAAPFPVASDGVRGLQRRILRTVRTGNRLSRSTREELEFIRVVPRPPDMDNRPIPGYFNVGQRRLRIAVSLGLRGSSPDVSSAGAYYYPLGVSNAATGTAISVCAPFLMNEDRSSLIEHPANDRLQEVAAELVSDLLITDWYDRFKAGAYEAVLPQAVASPFSERLRQSLATAPVWASRGRRGRRPRFQLATDLVMPAYPSLDGFVSEEKVLNGALAFDARVAAAAQRHGTRRFTINSLIRLRCADLANVSQLKTKLGSDEGNFGYSNYPDAFAGPSGVALQVRISKAIDDRYRQLSPSNRADLRETPTTMAADGSLAAPVSLWWVPPGVDAAHLPAPSRLHPDLAKSRVLRRLCLPYSPSDWVMQVCKRAENGTATESEVSALFRYLLTTHGRLPPAALAAVRRSPVVRDHRGEWVAPSALVSHQMVGAAVLEPVLSFPAKEYVRDSALLRRLRIRGKLRGSDLLAFAQSVEASTNTEAFEALLARVPALLTPKLAKALSLLTILQSTRGGLAAPCDLYIRSRHLEDAVGPAAAFVRGAHTDLYRRLGCRTLPKADDVIARIEVLREAVLGPSRPDLAYPVLVEALEREGRTLSEFAEEPIVWVEALGYVAPSTVLVGPRLPIALEGLPIIRGPELLCDALVSLGAVRTPAPRHWALLFRKIAAQYGPNEPLRRKDRDSLRTAYGRLAQPHQADLGLLMDERYLLSSSGTIHSSADVLRGAFVLNDDPAIAKAVLESAAAIAIADETESSQLFFRGLGLRTLSQIARSGKPALGTGTAFPSSVRLEDLLRQVQSLEFASATAAIIRQELGPGGGSPPRIRDLARRFASIRAVTAVETLEVVASIGGTKVRISRPYWLATDAIFVAAVRSREDFLSTFASALADASETPGGSRGRLSDSIYRLLGRRTSAVQQYLSQRGIAWTKPGGRMTDDATRGEDEEIAGALNDAVGRALEKNVAPTPASNAPPGQNNEGPARESQPTFELPPLDEVELSVRPSSDWSPPDRKGGGSGGGAGAPWRPPTPQDTERDAMVGRRAEELVFREEQKRVSARGQDPDRVVWVADANPGANHDILSVDDDDEDIYLEVKGAVGPDGRFHWPINEAKLAMTVRKRYILWRVYDVASTEPVARAFRDPIGMLTEGHLRVDVSTLMAEVEPLS